MINFAICLYFVQFSKSAFDFIILKVCPYTVIGVHWNNNKCNGMIDLYFKTYNLTAV